MVEPPATGQPEQATATASLHDDQLVVQLAGTWKLGVTTPPFAPLMASADASAVRSIGFNADDIGAWDSSLLIFVRQAEAYAKEHDLAFNTDGLGERIAQLLALASAAPERAAEPVVDEPSRVTRVGTAGIALYDSTVSAVTFVGEVAVALGRFATRQTRLPWRSFWVVVQSNSSGALPIVTLIALLVGVIIAFLGVVVLERFGAGYYVSYLVGFGMLREMGALMTGIIIAGRTGAGFAAELGSMKITEELDAYATLGISAVDYLVLPRVLGLFVMMPLLVVYADVVGILGGMAVAMSLLDLSATQFYGGLLAAVSLPDALLGVFKGLIFGLIVGVSGCFYGLRTGSDASAVGRAATSAVVLGITLIVLANAIVDWMAALWKI
jgi:phospholipid/cholesterol/gamma-HCH transport system permease protein